MQFDTAIDLQCLTKSAFAAWLSGARRRIGKAGADGRELSRWFHTELVAVGGSHVIEHYLDLLKPLGIEAPGVRFDLPELLPDARAAVISVLAAAMAVWNSAEACSAAKTLAPLVRAASIALMLWTPQTMRLSP